MTFTKEKINNIVIVLTALFYMFINCFNVKIAIWKGNFTVNILLYILLFLLIINAKEFINKKSKGIIMFILEIILLLLAYFNNNSGFGSIAAVLSFCIIIQFSSIIKISKTSLIIITLFAIPFWIISLTMDYNSMGVNPNGSGFIIYFMAIVLLSLIYTIINNIKIRKIITFFIIVITYLGTLKYECRNITINLILIAILSIFNFKSFFKKGAILKTILFWGLITIGSLIFTKVYIFFFEHNYHLNLSLISNKDFYSGRQIIWMNLYEVLKSNWLFGIGSKSYYFPANAHNYMLNVLALFGYPHFIAFIALIFNYIKDFFSEKLLNKNFICFISIVSLFILDFLEATFVDGIQLYFLLLLSIIFYSSEERLKKMKVEEIK